MAELMFRTYHRRSKAVVGEALVLPFATPRTESVAMARVAKWNKMYPHDEYWLDLFDMVPPKEQHE